MSIRISFARRTASSLVAYAARMLPSQHSPWAEAMQYELAHIENDLSALRWAAGCVIASCVERSRITSVMGLGVARSILALMIVGQALSMLLATVLTIAYRLHDLDDAAFLAALHLATTIVASFRL